MMFSCFRHFVIYGAVAILWRFSAVSFNWSAPTAPFVAVGSVFSFYTSKAGSMIPQFHIVQRRTALLPLSV
jgi:hypothetical protein